MFGSAQTSAVAMGVQPSAEPDARGKPYCSHCGLTSPPGGLQVTSHSNYMPDSWCCQDSAVDSCVQTRGERFPAWMNHQVLEWRQGITPAKRASRDAEETERKRQEDLRKWVQREALTAWASYHPDQMRALRESLGLAAGLLGLELTERRTGPEPVSAEFELALSAYRPPSRQHKPARGRSHSSCRASRNQCL